MKSIYNQQIAVYENAVPKEWCDKIIDLFDSSPDVHFTRDRDKVINNLQKDTASPLFHTLSKEEAIKLAYPFIKSFEECSKDYQTQYQIPEYFVLDAFKVQKTLPGEGYHIWHSEYPQVASSNPEEQKHVYRFGAYTLYLNDVEEGGETEFLYQHLRVSPKAGTLSIFPASFTHLHRGNPPLKGTKYIMTGWLLLPFQDTVDKILSSPTLPKSPIINIIP